MQMQGNDQHMQTEQCTHTGIHVYEIFQRE